MAKSMPGKKRPVDNCPNRLFLSYLKLWSEEAAEKGSKAYQTYNKAYKVLKKYPLPLESGKEAIILEHFGNKICAMLDTKLASEAESNGLSGREYLERSRTVPSSWWPTTDKHKLNNKVNNIVKHVVNSKKTKLARTYVPAKNSGAYALLLTLHDKSKIMSKAELQRSAQPLSTKSFTVPDRGTYYTAWNSMAALIKKKLVTKRSNPTGYELTETGYSLVRQIKCLNPFIHGDLKSNQVQSKKRNDSSVCLHFRQNSYPTKFPANKIPCAVKSACVDISKEKSDLEGEFFLSSGSFRIVLCVDIREIAGAERTRKKELKRMLDEIGVSYVEKLLHVGDFAWLAQELGVQPRELILDYIVERKCMSDLSQSIRDKRYHEQKTRLKESGIRNVIYLVEEPTLIEHQSLPSTCLRQALVNTHIIDHLSVKFCDDLSSTARYLKLMTSKLTQMFGSKILKHSKNKTCGRGVYELFSFNDFNNGNMKSKSLSVCELFIKQLVQLHGISYDKALAISRHYPSPASLFQGYLVCRTNSERESLLSSIKFGLSFRKLGISVSRSIFHLYNT